MPAKPVAIIMGSQSDWAAMKHAAETLDALAIGYDARIVSAQRATLVRLRDTGEIGDDAFHRVEEHLDRVEIAVR